MTRILVKTSLLRQALKTLRKLQKAAVPMQSHFSMRTAVFTFFYEDCFLFNLNMLLSAK